MNLFNELKQTIENSGKNVFSCLVYQNDEVKFEEYFNGKDAQSSSCIFSASKSVSSLLVGMALEKCPQFSTDTPIQQLLPEYRYVLEKDERKWNTTIGHCLSQTTPFKWLETGKTWGEGHSGWEMEQSSNWIEYLLNCPAVSKPGKRFCYNTGVSHLLPILVERMLQQSAEEFFEENVAVPLAFENYRWEKDVEGNIQGGKGLHLRALDLLKLGKLILNEGLWEGRELLSDEWIEDSFSAQSRGHIYYGTYGLHWWLKKIETGPKLDSGFNVWAAIGFGGNFLYIVPEWNLVVVFTGYLVGAENFEFPQEIFKNVILTHPEILQNV